MTDKDSVSLETGTHILFFILGLVLLVVGAEGIVRGGARLAAALRVSPLVIGLTIVAFGTSAPELLVTVVAALKGQSDIAMGNAVGSNIFNILAVLGPSALVAPLTVQAEVVRREVPIMLAVSFLLLLLALDGGISRLEGIGLFLGIVAYTVFSYLVSRRETREAQRTFQEIIPDGTQAHRPVLNTVYVVIGLVLLTVGARMLIDSAVPLARVLGISERVIALTLVSAGTSMPELATSIVAAFRRQTDIAVGNVIGSSIFNILCNLGAAAAISPLVVSPAILRFDLPVMLVVSVATLPIVMSQHRISRLEGGILTVGYFAYTVSLFVRVEA